MVNKDRISDTNPEPMHRNVSLSLISLRKREGVTVP